MDTRSSKDDEMFGWYLGMEDIKDQDPQDYFSDSVPSSKDDLTSFYKMNPLRNFSASSNALTEIEEVYDFDALFTKQPLDYLEDCFSKEQDDMKSSFYHSASLAVSSVFEKFMLVPKAVKSVKSLLQMKNNQPMTMQRYGC